MSHENADKMMMYAKDAMETSNPWRRWQVYRTVDDMWVTCTTHPNWELEKIRRVQPVVVINGFDVPLPISKVLPIGRNYFIPSLCNASKTQQYTWEGNKDDLKFLRQGLVHLSEENAKIHAEALISFTGNVEEL